MEGSILPGVSRRGQTEAEYLFFLGGDRKGKQLTEKEKAKMKSGNASEVRAFYVFCEKRMGESRTYIYMEGKVEEVEGEFEIRKAAVMPFPNQKNEKKNLNPVFEEPWEQAKQ